MSVDRPSASPRVLLNSGALVLVVAGDGADGRDAIWGQTVTGEGRVPVVHPRRP